MEKNVRWKHPDGAGGFTELNLPSSAELVAYGAGTVKDELDNLSATTGTSTFMRSLLRANNATEARALLNVAREDIFDETGNRWNSLGAFPDTSIKKFGAKSLHCGVGGGYLLNPTGITLGGKNFTIAFWTYAPAASTAAQGIFHWGTSTDCLLFCRDANNKTFITTFANNSATINPAAGDRVALPTAQWNHIEIGYRNSDQKLFFFLNGSLGYSNTDANFATARNLPIYLGYNPRNSSYYYVGYIDEVLVTEKLLHTSNFTPPTAPYDPDSDTLALLHFE